MLHVVDAKYLGEYRVWVAFDDGTAGEIDLTNRLHGAMFAPLRDRNLFGGMVLDRDAGTIVWPNGAELAPEYLHELAMASSTAVR